MEDGSRTGGRAEIALRALRRHNRESRSNVRETAQRVTLEYCFLATLDEQIPLMSETELNNLSANATRLLASGTAPQKAEAERLMPLIAEALVNAKANKAAETATKKVARQKEMADARAKRTARRKAEKEEALSRADEE